MAFLENYLAYKTKLPDLSILFDIINVGLFNGLFNITCLPKRSDN